MIKHEQGLQALGLLYRWLNWRYGPEGPNLMFQEGAQLVHETRAFVKEMSGREYEYDKTTDGKPSSD